jgi:cell cycle checkpoint control protein RAD9A
MWSSTSVQRPTSWIGTSKQGRLLSPATPRRSRLEEVKSTPPSVSISLTVTEILKQPTHTSVALERKDFNDFNVQEGLHIGTMVKDFRAIIAHAETMRTQVTARYSRGNRPMQISYEEGDLYAEFTLMTRGASNVPILGTRASTATPAREISMRPASRPPDTPGSASLTASRQQSIADGASMPPPARAALRGRNPAQPSLPTTDSTDSGIAPTPSASIDPDSLFIPAENEDQQWDEPNFAEEPDIVTWDNAGEDPMSMSMSSRRIRDSEMHSFASLPDVDVRNGDRKVPKRFPSEIDPTQRLSQFKGIFD